MRIINYRVYVLMILVIILLIFLAWKNKGKVLDKKAISQVKYFSYVIPILWLLLFIYLQFIFTIKKIQIYFFDAIVISFLAAIIMLLAIEISKNIIFFIKDKVLSTKYGGRKLTSKEVDYINNKEKLSPILWDYILAFIICGVIYSIVSEFMFNQIKLIELIMTAIFSTICYWLISKKLFTSSK